MKNRDNTESQDIDGVTVYGIFKKYSITPVWFPLLSLNIAAKYFKAFFGQIPAFLSCNSHIAQTNFPIQ